MVIERNDEFILVGAEIRVGPFPRGMWTSIKDGNNMITALVWGESLYESLVLLLNKRQHNG